MTDKQILINYQKNTIHRLQQECKELKNIINEAKNSGIDLKSFLVGEAVQNEYEYQLEQLKQTLVEIKEIAEKRNYLDYNECLDDILQKISESEVQK